MMVDGMSRRSPATRVAVAVLLLGAATATAARPDERLHVTLAGRLEPAARVHMGVRWDGEPGARFDAWLDLDGDGVPAPEELVVRSRSLEPGLQVVDLELPPGTEVASSPALWVDVREPGSLAPPGAALCPGREGCAWQPTFPVADLDGPVRALAVNDDGSGPALYAGGEFTTAGGVTVNNVARWDGSGLSTLSGPSGTGVNDVVNTLAVYDDGSGPALYAGGYFTTAGGVTVNSVARWDGSGWSALSGPAGTGVNDWGVYALAVFDDGSGPALYAGGTFSAAGGVTANRVARWGGSGWTALSGPSGTGVDGPVAALSVHDDGGGPALYAGGYFTTAGGVTVNSVARWDGGGWSALSGPAGTGVDAWVSALAGYDDGGGPALYDGGYFLYAGGLVSPYLAEWRCGFEGAIFADGFESGGTDRWHTSVP